MVIIIMFIIIIIIKVNQIKEAVLEDRHTHVMLVARVFVTPLLSAEVVVCCDFQRILWTQKREEKF